MTNLVAIIAAIALTAACWGGYGPMLRWGGEAMGSPTQPDHLRPFICVGLAYFLIAVLAPAAYLSFHPEKGSWTIKGAFWSIFAGALGAIGALGIIMAFSYGGKPILVMPLVFGCAPVVNTFFTMITQKSYRGASSLFFTGLILVVMGACCVLLNRPAELKPIVPAKPVAVAVGEEIRSAYQPAGAETPEKEKPAEPKPEEPKPEAEPKKEPAAEKPPEPKSAEPESKPAEPAKTAPTKTEPAATTEPAKTGEPAKTTEPAKSPAEATTAAATTGAGTTGAATSAAGTTAAASTSSAATTAASSAAAATSAPAVGTAPASSTAGTGGGGHAAGGHGTEPSLVMVLLWVAATALSWGTYGPILHWGQAAMGHSRLRPLIGVGIAYFLIAVLIPVGILQSQGGIGELNARGVMWSLAGGSAGALGALGIIMAFASGGRPIYVMPLVFGVAPIVNTLLTLFAMKDHAPPHPLFYAGLLMVAAGAVIVLVFAPAPPKAAAHAPASAPSTPPSSTSKKKKK